MKKRLSYIVFPLLITNFLLTNQLSGAVTQTFIGINYENPAAFNRVKKVEFTTGVDYLNPKLKFKGTSTITGSGVARSHPYDFLPYGQIAYRFNKKVVGAFSVSQPLYADINWGRNSFIRYTTTSTIEKNVTFGPKISYQCSDKLAIGLGMDFIYTYNGQVNWVTDGFGQIKNKNKYFSLGFNAGIFYTFTPKTFLSVAYYSGQLAAGQGSSRAETGEVNYSYSLARPNAWLTYIQLIHVFNPKFMGYGKIYYSGWSICRNFKFKNTVLGTLIAPTRWKNTWTFEAGGKYTINDCWELLGIVAYDTNFADHRFNTVGYPGSGVGSAGIGVIRKITDSLKLYGFYGHAIFLPKAKIDNSVDKGKVSLNNDYVGVRLVWAY